MFLKALLIVLCAIQAQGKSAPPKVLDPLCATKACPDSEECRVVLDNPDTDKETLRAECMLRNIEGVRQVCKIGETILVEYESKYYDLSCGPDMNCPNSTYCYTEARYTRDVCCRSDPSNPVKPGVCPTYPAQDSECLNKCYNDGDCIYHSKCCTYGCQKLCLYPQEA